MADSGADDKEPSKKKRKGTSQTQVMPDMTMADSGADDKGPSKKKRKATSQDVDGDVPQYV